MQIDKRWPRLSLKFYCHVHKKDVEVYPLVIKEVTKRVKNFSEENPGSSDHADFVSNSVLAVLTRMKAYRADARTRMSTYIYQRIGGAFLDLMRREVTYQKRFELTAEAPEVVSVSPEADYINRIMSERAMRIMRNRLSEVELFVIYQHYWLDTSLVTIAKILWLRPDQVRYIHQHVLTVMRDALTTER